MIEIIEMLDKNDDNSSQPLNTINKYNVTKETIKGIFASLCVDTGEYEATSTVKIIEGYIKMPEKMDRILYSVISSHVFALDTEKRGMLSTNFDKLLSYSLSNSTISIDSLKIIIKLYDHFQLVSTQTDNVKSILEAGVEEAKENLKSEIKGIEKEHISILGIFASIVLAFVGGMTFSTSVLQNMIGVSIYRLLAIVDLLGFIFINVVWLLIKFIATINEKNLEAFKIKWFNIFCIAFACIIFISWIFKIEELPNFLSKFFSRMK